MNPRLILVIMSVLLNIPQAGEADQAVEETNRVRVKCAIFSSKVGPKLTNFFVYDPQEAEDVVAILRERHLKKEAETGIPQSKLWVVCRI